MTNNKSYTFITNFSDLLEIQRSSFYRFLLEGITKELNSFIINPFSLIFSENSDPINTFYGSNYECTKNPKSATANIYFYPSKLKVKGPIKSLLTCFEREETYAANLYIQGEIVKAPQKLSAQRKRFCTLKKDKIKISYKKGVRSIKLYPQFINYQATKIVIKKYFYLATIPFLTEDASFFVNGCERVVINQIVRSPGVYFRKEYLGLQKTFYTATFISDNSVWTKFILDTTPQNIKLLNTSAQSDFQTGLNISALEKATEELPKKYDVYLNLEDSNFWQEIAVSKNSKDGSNELLLVNIALGLGLTIEEILDNLKYPSRLSLPEIFNKSNLLLEPKDRKSLDEKAYHDSTAASAEGEYSLMGRSLDHIFGETEEKAYFSIGAVGRNHLNKRLGLNLPESAKFLTGLDFLKIVDALMCFKEDGLTSDDIDDLKNKQIRGVGDLIRNQLRLAIYRWIKHPKSGEETFRPKHLINYVNGNIKKTRFSANSFTLSSNLKLAIERGFREFFLSSQLSQYFDETNPLAELAHKRRISVFGPDGLQRENVGTKIRDIHPSHYGKICPIETPEGENAGLVMSLASFARVNQYGWLESPYLIVEKSAILRKTKVFYLNSSQENRYKLAFANNELNQNSKFLVNSIYAKDGSYFSKTEPESLDFSLLSPFQILSVGAILVPFVEHDDANRALMGSNMQRQAVPLLFSQAPFVGTGFEPNVAAESGLVLKSEAEGHICFASSSSIEIEDAFGQKILYKLKKYYRSNQETCNNQSAIFWPGEKVYAGQIIGDSSATVNGELSLGTNLFIGYLPWEGYNYEDAIVINEKLVTQNVLTSLHISTYQIVVKPTKTVLKKVSRIVQAARKNRDFKRLFRYLKTLSAQADRSLSYRNAFKKLSENLFKNMRLLNKSFIYSTHTYEHFIGREKVSAYVGKNDSYLCRNLSSNGIIKIGSNISSGDILVSKVQAIDSSKSKSSYQKLFEDLQINEPKEARKKVGTASRSVKALKLKVHPLENDVIKLNLTVQHLKSLNSNNFKALILLKRLKSLQNTLCSFLDSIYNSNHSITSNLSIKSLLVKHKLSQNYLELLISQLKVEKERKVRLNSYLERLVKILTQSFYKKLYVTFWENKFNKKFDFAELLKTKFKQKLIETQLGKSSFLIGQAYFKAKHSFLDTLKNLHAIALDSSLINSTKLYFSSQLFSELSLKALQTLTFDPNLHLKLADQFFISHLNTLNFNRYKETAVVPSSTNQFITYKDTSLVAPVGTQGKVIGIKILPISSEDNSPLSGGFTIKISVLEARKIQIGDKLSGRHGNKGVISRILPSNDMPIMPDGTTLDILVNPLGVPSRMNVGQLLECALGLSAIHLGNRFKVRPFDERFGTEASIVFINQNLKRAALATQRPWIYNEDSPGKFYLRDGRTGEFFDNPITVGVAYILKLIHLVEDKIHSRALGPYNKITEQPLQGKAASGGQRFGEMEVWALEAYGCSQTLQEMLTVKSDDIDGRNDLYKAISSGNYYNKPNPNFSETLVSLIRELNSLGLDFQFFKAFPNVNPLGTFNYVATKIEEEIKIFNLLENRLKLRFKVDELKSSSLNPQKISQTNGLMLSEAINKSQKLLFDYLGK
jgi:DNA-directed RNA polymerase beta subunit